MSFIHRLATEDDNNGHYDSILSVTRLVQNKLKVSATLKIAIFPYLRFQRFQIGMLESFHLKKKSEENIISVERYRGLKILSR